MELTDRVGACDRRTDIGPEMPDLSGLEIFDQSLSERSELQRSVLCASGLVGKFNLTEPDCKSRQGSMTECVCISGAMEDEKNQTDGLISPPTGRATVEI